MFALGLLGCATARAPAGFDGLRCEDDVRAALLGRSMPSAPVAETEARHADLGLQHLGAFGVEPEGDPWTAVSWALCGHEHLLLQKGGVVRDVLVAPSPPNRPPSVLLSCTVGGQPVPGTAVAWPAVTDAPWPKVVAPVWRIDEAALKFQPVAAGGGPVTCAP